MPCFKRDGVEIAFLDQGEGEPIVLVHGFTLNKEENWVLPGWVNALTCVGRRVIALDIRGHGQSTKLYDPAAYRNDVITDDVRALIDHVGLSRVDIMGYSMGARYAALAALAYPGRVRSAVLGGLGLRLVDSVGLPESVADALEAPSLADVSDSTAYMFRVYGESTRSDLRALAAFVRGSRQTLSREDVSQITVPVLIAVGTKDPMAGSAEDLAALVPGSRVLLIPNRDHILMIGDRAFKSGVVDFLDARS